MKITIKVFEKKILIFLFYYSLFIQGLMSLFGLPQQLLYIKDVLLILCFLLFLYDKKLLIQKSFTIIVPFLFYIICIVSASCNGLLLKSSFLIATRKCFRGFVYFVLVNKYLNFSDFKRTIEKVYAIQSFNLLIIMVQRLLLGIGQDHSNGIFGTGMTNNYNSVLALVLICFCTVEYMNNDIELTKWIKQLLVNCMIAAIAELKVLFFLIPLAIIIILREKIFKGKGLKISVFLIAGVFLFLVVFGVLYGEQLNVLISVNGLKNYNQWGLASHAEVTRLNWLKYTLDNIFDNNLYRLIGKGFGTVSGMVYGTEQNSYNILGFGAYCASTVFLETGFCGIIVLLLWFLILLFQCIKKQDFSSCFIRAFSMCMIVFLFYSNFLFNDSCFIAFFALGLYQKMTNRCSYD